MVENMVINRKNTRYKQIGDLAKFKVGDVFGKLVINQKIKLP